MPGHYGQSGTSSGVSQGHSHSPAETNRERGIRAHATTGSSYTGGVSDPEPAHEYIGGEKVYIGDEIGKQQALEKANIAEAEKVGFWDQVTNAASEFIQSGGLVGNVIKLGGDVLSKLGDYSSSLQKKAMTYHLENQITNIGNKKDFHPGAYGYKIQDIQKDIEAIEKGNFKQSDFNKKYGSPELSVGGGEGGRDVMNMIAPAAPYIVGGNTPQESQAAKWYASLGQTQNNGFGFSFANEFAAAKQKQAGILGNPSPVGMLAVNNSPFYNFLKERNLNKGIL
jgi:hypothetical protein